MFAVSRRCFTYLRPRARCELIEYVSWHFEGFVCWQIALLTCDVFQVSTLARVKEDLIRSILLLCVWVVVNRTCKVTPCASCVDVLSIDEFSWSALSCCPSFCTVFEFLGCPSRFFLFHSSFKIWWMTFRLRKLCYNAFCRWAYSSFTFLRCKFCGCTCPCCTS